MFPPQTRSTKAVMTIWGALPPVIQNNGQQIWVMGSMTNSQIQKIGYSFAKHKKLFMAVNPNPEPKALYYSNTIKVSFQ